MCLKKPNNIMLSLFFSISFDKVLTLLNTYDDFWWKIKNKIDNCVYVNVDFDFFDLDFTMNK